MITIRTGTIDKTVATVDDLALVAEAQRARDRDALGEQGTDRTPQIEADKTLRTRIAELEHSLEAVRKTCDRYRAERGTAIRARDNLVTAARWALGMLQIMDPPRSGTRRSYQSGVLTLRDALREVSR